MIAPLSKYSKQCGYLKCTGFGIFAKPETQKLAVLVRKQRDTSTSAANNHGDLDEDVRSECVKCLRILMNTEPGFVMVLRSQLIVSKIAFCLHTSNDKLRNMVAEVLAALCVLSPTTGYRMVMVALMDFKGFFNERHRFEFLVDSIIGSDPLGTFR